MRKEALISACGLYRYSLTRVWDEDLPTAAFVLLNPSTADASQDDPTLRKGIGFAKRWGFGGVEFANLFAFRSTDPKNLPDADDPVGPGNDAWIIEVCRRSERVVLAWGQDKMVRYLDRSAAVVRILEGFLDKPLYCLGKTQKGHPKHILFLPYETELVEWRAACERTL